MKGRLLVFHEFSLIVKTYHRQLILQRYNYLLSLKKGINPDYPRNLAKVVTV